MKEDIVVCCGCGGEGVGEEKERDSVKDFVEEGVGDSCM